MIRSLRKHERTAYHEAGHFVLADKDEVPEQWIERRRRRMIESSLAPFGFATAFSA